MTRSTPSRSTALVHFNCSDGMADGWTTIALRLGANRAISEAQLASREAGATRSDGLRLLPASRFEHQQQRQDLNGLAEPHVVGKAGPEPQLCKQMEPLHARMLIGPQRPVKRSTGIDARRPVWLAQRCQRLGEPGPGNGLAPVDVGSRRGLDRRKCRRRTAGAWPRRTTGPQLRRGARSPRTAPGSGSIAHDRPRPTCRG